MGIRYEVDDAVAIVTLDRPEKLNALTVEMREALGTAFESAGRDPAVRAVLLCASGKTFDPASGILARVQSAGLEVGLICRSLRDILAVCPPLIITEAQIDELFDKLAQSLDLAHADARKAGLMP